MGFPKITSGGSHTYFRCLASCATLVPVYGLSNEEELSLEFLQHEGDEIDEKLGV